MLLLNLIFFIFIIINYFIKTKINKYIIDFFYVLMLIIKIKNIKFKSNILYKFKLKT